jgi:EpsI family protein
MSRDNRAAAVLLAAMLGVGAAGWWVELRPALRVDPSRLSTLPLEIDGFAGHPIPVEEAVERILEADYNLQRAYTSREDGEPVVWLYVGYYGTRRGGRPEHTPDQCYPSAGWQIQARRSVPIDPARGLRANEYVVSRDSEQHVVYFWYRSHRATGLLGAFDQGLDRMRGRFAGGRADGALVRISTPFLPGGEERARARLDAFARQLDPLFDQHWPVEFPAG